MPTQQEIEAQRRNDYTAVFGTDVGRKVLRDMMASSYFFAPTATAIDTDGALIREGRRSLVRDILYLIDPSKNPIAQEMHHARSDYAGSDDDRPERYDAADVRYPHGEHDRPGGAGPV